MPYALFSAFLLSFLNSPSFLNPNFLNHPSYSFLNMPSSFPSLFPKPSVLPNSKLPSFQPKLYLMDGDFWENQQLGAILRVHSVDRIQGQRNDEGQTVHQDGVFHLVSQVNNAKFMN